MPSYSAPSLRVAASFVAIASLLVCGPAVAKKSKKPKTTKTSADRAEIEGKVVSSADDKAIPGALVTLTGAGADLSVVADAEGGFELIVPAAAGSYAIHLAKDGFASYEAEVNLVAGQRYAFTFSLIDQATGRRQAAATAYNEGAAFYQQEAYAEAKARFLAAAENDPDLVEARLGLANVYLGEDDLDAAVEAVEAFLAVRPDEMGAKRLAFEIYRRQGNLQKLDPLIEAFEGTEEAANLAAQLFNDGVVALNARDEDGAIAFFEAAHRLGPKLAEPLTGLATVQYNQQDYEGLAATLERLDTAVPNHPRSHRLRFLLHDARGETEQAMTAFEAYRAIDSAAALDLLYKRAEIDFREGRPGQARRALERILEADPDHARAHYTLGLALASADELSGAKKHLERFISLAPDDPDAATAREMLPHLGG